MFCCYLCVKVVIVVQIYYLLYVCNLDIDIYMLISVYITYVCQV